MTNRFDGRTITADDKLLIEELVLEKLRDSPVPLSVMDIAVSFGFKRPMLADNFNMVRDALRRLKTKGSVEAVGMSAESGNGNTYRLKWER